MWWQLLLGLAAGLFLVYVLLLFLLWRAGRRGTAQLRLGESLRLLPDVVRLLRRVIADSTLPTGVRLIVVLLLIYLASPIDLVPDFIPVIGYADDAIVVALALRLVTRRAGASAIEKHWPGTEAGLDAVRRLAGLADSTRAEPGQNDRTDQNHRQLRPTDPSTAPDRRD